MSKKDPNNHIIIKNIVSQSNPAKTYNIGVDKRISEELGHVHFTCDCTSFKFSGKGGVERHCKHTEEFAKKYLNNNASDKRKALSEIIGWEIAIHHASNKLKLVAKKSPITTIISFLTEIMCPSIICSHVMFGNFNPNEIQVCSKCQRQFVP
jgi:hypothetical protein